MVGICRPPKSITTNTGTGGVRALKLGFSLAGDAACPNFGLRNTEAPGAGPPGALEGPLGALGPSVKSNRSGPDSGIQDKLHLLIWVGISNWFQIRSFPM